jgi:hypothetical protein
MAESVSSLCPRAVEAVAPSAVDAQQPRQSIVMQCLPSVLTRALLYSFAATCSSYLLAEMMSSPTFSTTFVLSRTDRSSHTPVPFNPRTRRQSNRSACPRR